MKRLTNDEFLTRVRRRNPDIRPLEEYVKAAIPMKALCTRCGNTLTREAFANTRFGCTFCSRRRHA